jgi:F420-0:gamma-glutamyl ligase-like protein
MTCFCAHSRIGVIADGPITYRSRGSGMSVAARATIQAGIGLDPAVIGRLFRVRAPREINVLATPLAQNGEALEHSTLEAATVCACCRTSQ